MLAGGTLRCLVGLILFRAVNKPRFDKSTVVLEIDDICNYQLDEIPALRSISPVGTMFCLMRSTQQDKICAGLLRSQSELIPLDEGGHLSAEAMHECVSCGMNQASRRKLTCGELTDHQADVFRVYSVSRDATRVPCGPASHARNCSIDPRRESCSLPISQPFENHSLMAPVPQ